MKQFMKPKLLDSGAAVLDLDVASLHKNTNLKMPYVPPEEHKTSIILVSNLVPMHPDINMTVGILDSAFKYLEGLSPSTPVYISIDGLSDPESILVRRHNYAANTEPNRERLQKYISNLRKHYLPQKNVHILPSVVFGHINYNIARALEVVETKYVYVIQHDLAFAKPINHTALVKTFDEFYPKDIWKVEFTHTRAPKDEKWAKGPCLNMSTPVSHVNEIYLTKQTGWSDSNHLTTKEYYLDVLKQIGPVKRSPEFPMNNAASKNCTFMGTHKYGKVDEMPPQLVHRDGRFSKASE